MAIAPQDQWYVVHVLSGLEQRCRRISIAASGWKRCRTRLRGPHPDGRVRKSNAEEDRNHTEVFPRLSHREHEPAG